MSNHYGLMFFDSFEDLTKKLGWDEILMESDSIFVGDKSLREIIDRDLFFNDSANWNFIYKHYKEDEVLEDIEQLIMNNQFCSARLPLCLS